MSEKQRYAFIVFLRAFAACLITNCHYDLLYPVKIFGSGGLLGDVLFFAVSGFCLWRPGEDDRFLKWYRKRFFRCLVPVWVITTVYALSGFYHVEANNFLWHYLFPTNYHFVSSIVILYIPFFFCMKFFHEKTRQVSLILWTAYFLLYALFYDKSRYHIDNVHEPMIWFLFFQSMLLGAMFREKRQREDGGQDRGVAKWKICVSSVMILLSGAAYACSKIYFSRAGSAVAFQFVNQGILYLLLFCIFRLFAMLDGALPKNKFVMRPVGLIAELTLEIYIVQYPIIRYAADHVKFPANWFLCTASIFLAAFLLHWVCAWIFRFAGWCGSVAFRAGARG